MRVQFVPRENGPEKLVCDAEIVFGPECGALSGTKLVGFSLWRGAEDDKSLAEMLDRRGFERGANAFEERVALVAVAAEHADLDELVDGQCQVDLVHHGGRQAVVADGHEGTEAMRLGTACAAFGRREADHRSSVTRHVRRSGFDRPADSADAVHNGRVGRSTTNACSLTDSGRPEGNPEAQVRQGLVIFRRDTEFHLPTLTTTVIRIYTLRWVVRIRAMLIKIHFI